MDAIDYIRIRSQNAALVLRMDVSPQFLSYLYSDGVIGDSVMDEVLSQPAHSQRTLTILRMLTKADLNGKSPLPSFLNALRKCGQGFLADDIEDYNVTIHDIFKYKGDLKAFLRRGETVESLIKRVTKDTDQMSMKTCVTRQSWPIASGARRKEPVHRSTSDSAVQCPSEIETRKEDTTETVQENRSIQTGSGNSSRSSFPSGARPKDPPPLPPIPRPTSRPEIPSTSTPVIAESPSAPTLSPESRQNSSQVTESYSEPSFKAESNSELFSSSEAHHSDRSNTAQSTQPLFTIDGHSDLDLPTSDVGLTPSAVGTYMEPDRGCCSSSEVPSGGSTLTYNSLYEPLDSDVSRLNSSSTYSSLATTATENIYENDRRPVKQPDPVYEFVPQRTPELKFPTINAVFLELKTSWKAGVMANNSTFCIPAVKNGDIIVCGGTPTNENEIAVHDLNGKKKHSWTFAGEYAGSNSAVVFPGKDKKSILVVASSDGDKQLDLYEVGTGKFLRHCSYYEFNPGSMSNGPAGKILVIDRSTDPWKIAVLDTTIETLPIVKRFTSGIRRISGICFAEVKNKKVIFVASSEDQCLIAIDWESGGSLWRKPTIACQPHSICKSKEGCLLVSSLKKRREEIYIFDFNGNHITTLSPPGVQKIMDLQCVTKDNQSFLVLGQSKNRERTMTVLKLCVRTQKENFLTSLFSLRKD